MHSTEQSAGKQAACLNEKDPLSRSNAKRHVLGSSTVEISDKSVETYTYRSAAVYMRDRP